MLASEIARSIRLDALIQTEGNACLAAFADTLTRDHTTTIEAFLSRRPAEDRANLPSLIALELRHRLERGVSCSVEAYFERFPELRNDHEKVVDLIYAEYCERKQFEQHVESAEYYRRFPEFAQSLNRLFRIDSLFGTDDAPLNLPEQGDEFLDFRLVAELGRGAFGRVFLAEQFSLSNRLVVVKITSERTIEHQTLARLRHPNIVPVFSVHRDELTGLQAVCMPHQGAVSLSAVRTVWKDRPGVPSRAEAFLEALERLTPSDYRKLDTEADAPQFPRGRSFVFAAAWMFHRLALALAHAHARGILHRDLKPSNVLLTAAAQPLLVDFNLAFNQVDSQGNPAAFFGGTLPYMPPEQLAALHPIEDGSADQVDPRSDIFALAATFFELMTGEFPFGEPSGNSDPLAVLREQLERRYSTVPSARTLNHAVPWDLHSLLTKSLHPNPDQRYETAADLADDLRRFLEHRTLRHIGKVPRRRVIAKLIQRNWPRLVAGAFALCTACVLGGLFYRSHMKTEIAQAMLAREQEQLALEKHRAVTEYEAAFEELARKYKNLTPEQFAAQVFARGFDYNQQRYYRVAILFCTKAVELGYNDPQVFGVRARCYQLLDEDKLALEDLDLVIQRRPDYWYWYKERAIVFATSRKGHMDCDRAIQDVDDALRFRPADDDPFAPGFYVDLARALASASLGAKKTSSEDVLDRAQAYLFKALDLGWSVDGIITGQKLDRFKMLGPLFERPKVRERLQLDSEP